MILLILGGTGMLGHKLLQQLGEVYPDTYATVRQDLTKAPFDRVPFLQSKNLITDVDVADTGLLRKHVLDLKPDYILNGARLQRNKNSEITEVRLPVLQLIQKTGQWKVSADKALLNDDNETVRLISNVVMQQQNIEPAMTIRTQNLSINAALKTARTKADVDITQGKSRLQSRGMIYNNITNELKLLSNVNGYYLPQD